MNQVQTEVRTNKLDDYAGLLGSAEIAELRALASRLGERTVRMVNSTSVGGGVAEMLNRIVPLMQELNLVVRWDLITGGDVFLRLPRLFTMRCTAAGTICRTKASRHFLLTRSRIARGFSLIPIQFRRDSRSPAGGLDRLPRQPRRALDLALPHRSFPA